MTDLITNIMTNSPMLVDQLVVGLKDVVLGVIILILGVLFAWIFGKATKWAVHRLHIDKKLKEKKLQKGLLGFTVARLSSLFVKILVFLAFAISASSFFHLPGLVTFTESTFGVVAQMLNAAVVVFLSLLLGEYIALRIKESKITLANTWTVIVKVIIAVMGVTIALESVTFVSAHLLSQIITVFAYGIALAFGLTIGLAFGLGGQDVVKSVLKKKKNQIKELL